MIDPRGMVDPLAVGAILARVAREEILPRHRRLAAGDIREKGPGDLVTEADLAAEAALAPALTALLPGSLAVGEEAVAADPTVLDRLSGDAPVWVVDPIDGTANFVAGRDDFAVMVALIRRGETLAGWIHRPTSGDDLIAELGSGVTLNGAPIRLDGPPQPAAALHVAVHPRYLPDHLRGPVEAARGAFRDTRSSDCAAVEYQAILTGASDGALYWRLMPWDHAAGALMLREAGARVAHLDGRPYVPAPPVPNGLLVARDPKTWDLLRGILFSAHAPGQDPARGTRG